MGKYSRHRILIIVYCLLATTLLGIVSIDFVSSRSINFLGNRLWYVSHAEVWGVEMIDRDGERLFMKPYNSREKHYDAEFIVSYRGETFAFMSPSRWAPPFQTHIIFSDSTEPFYLLPREVTTSDVYHHHRYYRSFQFDISSLSERQLAELDLLFTLRGIYFNGVPSVSNIVIFVLIQLGLLLLGVWFIIFPDKNWDFFYYFSPLVDEPNRTVLFIYRFMGCVVVGFVYYSVYFLIGNGWFSHIGNGWWPPLF